MKLIAWCNKKQYEVAKKYVDGFIIERDSKLPSEARSNNSDSILELTWFSLDVCYECIYSLLYIDEPKTVYNQGVIWDRCNIEKKILKYKNRLIVSEPDLDYLQEYQQYGNLVTFSSYRRYIKVKLPKFLVNVIDKLFKHDVSIGESVADARGFTRIPIAFTNQLFAWVWLEYLSHVSYFYFQRFTHVWISQEKNFKWYNKWQLKKLVQWAVNHDKTIMLCGLSDDAEKLEKFLQTIKKYIGE